MVTQNEFNFLLVLLKYLKEFGKNHFNENKNVYELKKEELYIFLKRHLLTQIEIKNNLLINFDSLIISLNSTFYIFEETYNTLTIDKDKICNVFRPLIKNRINNPIEIKNLNEFFNLFACVDDSEFTEILL